MRCSLLFLLFATALHSGCTRAGFALWGDGGPRDAAINEAGDQALPDGDGTPSPSDLTVAVPTLDPAFNSGQPVTLLGGSSWAQFKSVALDSRGRIVFAGHGRVDGRPLDVIASRLLDDGRLDPSFNNGAVYIGIDPTIHEHVFALALTADDAILIGGGQSGTAKNQYMIVKLREDGTLDTSFGELQGVELFSRVTDAETLEALLVDPDGTIAFAGTQTPTAGTRRVVYGQRSADGLKASTMPAEDIGLVLDNSHLAKLVRVGARHMLGSRFYDANLGHNIVQLAAFENGTIDPAFGQQGVISHPLFSPEVLFRDIAADGQGRLYVCMTVDTTTAGVLHTGVARFLADGTLDASYGDRGVVELAPALSSIPYSLIIDGENRVIVAGQAQHVVDGPNDLFLLRLESAGAPDASFSAPDGYSVIELGGDERVRQTILDAQGRLIVTGWWDINGQGGGWVARFLLPD